MTCTASPFTSRRLRVTKVEPCCSAVAARRLSMAKLLSAAMLWYGARLVIGQQLSVGQFVAFNMFAQPVAQPIMRMAQLWTRAASLPLPLRHATKAPNDAALTGSQRRA